MAIFGTFNSLSSSTPDDVGGIETVSSMVLDPSGLPFSDAKIFKKAIVGGVRDNPSASVSIFDKVMS